MAVGGIGPGELACLAAAALWAGAVVWLRPSIARAGAPAINLLKCLLATALWGVTLAFTGELAALRGVSVAALGWLAASGLVGLSLGDTALFAAVRRTGAHHALLLQTLAPVFTAALAIPAGERLGPMQLAGGIVVLAGVGLVIRGAMLAADARNERWEAVGVVFGILGAFGQGAGVTLAKWGLTETTVLQGTLVRLTAATVGLLLVGALRGQLPALSRALRDRETLRTAIPASLVATYLALMLMTAGIAWAPASVASVLLATAPVFSLVVEALIDRRRPTAISVIGTLIAVAGVALLVTSG